MRIIIKNILITVFMLGLLQGPKAQDSSKMENNPDDIAVIKGALEKYYFTGIYEGNLDLLNQIYYKGTLLFGDVKSEPYEKTLDQYLDGVKNRLSPKDSGKPFKADIISVHVINSVAAVEVKVKMYDFDYHEFLSFHKLNSKWIIVNKMISDISK